MGRNEKLNRAKSAKNDEFYTRYEDIEAECENYDFSGMTVYCNCDDYEKSNFFKYFHDNFEKLKLKKLITSAINGNACFYDGKEMQTFALKDGSFDSEETQPLLEEADIVVTNPPFSNIIDFWGLLKRYNKKFLYIVPQVFLANWRGAKGIIDDEYWIGYTNPQRFDTPEGLKSVNTYFLTNMNTGEYPKVKDEEPPIFADIANYKGSYIDVPEKVLFLKSMKDFPEDYEDYIAVPVGFFTKYRRTAKKEEKKENWINYYHTHDIFGMIRPMIDGKEKFTRYLVKRKPKKTEEK